MPYQTAKKAGFTLIELLVAIGIMVVVMGSGTVILTGFSRRQQTQAVARELQTFLRSGQNYARVGTLPNDCKRPLISYEITFTDAGVGTLRANCTSAADPLTIITSTTITTFDKGTAHPIGLVVASVPDTSFTIRFLPLYGGVQTSTDGVNFSPISDGATKTIFISRSGSTTYSLSINSSGAISDPVAAGGGG